MVYEVLRLLEELKESDNLPKVLIMENVIDLIQAKFIDAFNEIQRDLELLGYTNYTQTLNAKNYGIAQNRDRVFMVSILGEYNYNFPKPFKLKYRLKDYLESDVDESYYLSDKAIQGRLNTNYQKYKLEENLINAEGVRSTILARYEGAPSLYIPEATKKGYALAKAGDGIYLDRPHQKRGVVQDGMIQTLKTSGNDVGVVLNEPIAVAQRGRYNENGELKQQFEVNDNGMSNALTTAQKDMMVLEPKNAKQELTNKMLATGNYEPYDMVRHSYTKERMGNLERKENENNISATLTTRPDTLGVVVGSYDYGSSDSFMKGKSRLQENPKFSNTIITSPNVGLAIKEKNNLRIRKLTPTETGRLMGMQDYQIERQEKVSSNAQMYKQHGNGIVAQVIGLIIGMLYYDNEVELKGTVMKNSFGWLK